MGLRSGAVLPGEGISPVDSQRLDAKMRSAVNLVSRAGVDLHVSTAISLTDLCELLDTAAHAEREPDRLAQAWREGADTALAFAIRNDDGVTLRLEKPNPYENDTRSPTPGTRGDRVTDALARVRRLATDAAFDVPDVETSHGVLEDVTVVLLSDLQDALGVTLTKGG